MVTLRGAWIVMHAPLGASTSASQTSFKNRLSTGSLFPETVRLSEKFLNS